MAIKKKQVLPGLLIGEHGFNIETLKEELTERVLNTGCKYCILNTSRVKWWECENFDKFVEAAKLLAEKRYISVFAAFLRRLPKE